MCVILIGDVNAKLYEEALAQNPNGCSVFTREYGLIKAPTKEQVMDAIGKFGIWHFRIATSGRIDKANIHPFSICKGRYLLYHNGVLGAGRGAMSDTVALAKTLNEVNLTTARSVVKALAESRQRFVIADARDPRNFEVFGEWSAESGILMSHKMYDYKGGTSYATGTVFKR